MGGNEGVVCGGGLGRWWGMVEGAVLIPEEIQTPGFSHGSVSGQRSSFRSVSMTTDNLAHIKAKQSTKEHERNNQAYSDSSAQ